MASKKAVETVFSAIDHISPVFKDMEGGAEAFKSKAKDAFSQLSKESQNFGNILKGVTAGNLLSKGIEKAVSLVKSNFQEAVQYASDLKEVQFVVKKVFENSGNAIEEFANKAQREFGLTTLQAKQFVTGFGSVFRSMGFDEASNLDMSKMLTGLSGDISSYYNTSHEDAFRMLQGAMMGNTQSLRQRIGVDVSATAMEEYAKKTGLVWKQLDKNSQALLRYKAIQEKTEQAHGDFMTPGESWAVSSRVMEGALKAMKGALVEGLLPGMIKLADAATEIAQKIQAWAEANKELIKTKVDEAVNFLLETLPKIWEFLVKNQGAIIGITTTVLLFTKIIKGIKIISALKNVIALITGVAGAVTGAGAAATAAGTAAGSAAAAFTGLSASIALTTLAVASLVAVAAGGIVALVLLAQKNRKKMLDEELNKYELTEKEYYTAQDRASERVTTGYNKWEEANNALNKITGAGDYDFDKLSAADKGSVYFWTQQKNENERYNHWNDKTNPNAVMEKAMREEADKIKANREDPLAGMKDLMEEQNRLLEDQLGELEGLNTKATPLRWQNMGTDFWETVRLGV